MSTVSKLTPFTLPSGSETTTWNNVSAGATYTFGIDSENYLFAWGLGTSGQLGDGTAVTKSSPVQIGTQFTEDSYFTYLENMNLQQRSWSQFASTLSTMAGITSNGSLYVWGLGSQGELGINNTLKTLSYPTRLGSMSWTTVCAGASHFAALRKDGKLFTWGSNSSGQLGINDLENRSSPVQIGTQSWTSINAGASNTVAIDAQYRLWTWGSNSFGQLGIGSIISKSSPMLVGTKNDNGYYSVYFPGTNAILSTTTSSLGNDFTIEAWILPLSAGTGRTIYDNRGTVNTTTGILFLCEGASNLLAFRTATNTQYLSSFSVPLGSWTHVALVRNSNVISLYANGQNVLSINNSVSFTDTSSRIGSTIDLNAAYSMVGYISNLRVVSNIALYTADFTPSTSPLTNISGTTLLACQSLEFSDNSDNNYQLTVGGTPVTSQEQPFNDFTYVYTGNSWVTASLTSNAVAAVTSDGTLFTWGDSTNGQSGRGLLSHRSTPAQVTTFAGNETVIDQYVSNIGYSGIVYDSWVSVASTPSFTMAVRSDGKLFGWGDNSQGQLGIDSTVSTSIPTMVGNSSWTQVYATAVTETLFTIALRADGKLFTWGGNTSGNLGNNSTVHRSSPVQVGSDNWSQVSTNGAWVLALRNNGLLYAWGINTTGMLGDNTIISKSSPIQVGTSSWIQVSAGGLGPSAAIRSDGALFTWGTNTNGELGSNSRIHRSSPVQVGTSSWIQVSAGGVQLFAIRIDYGLFSWGANESGRLGSNSSISRSSPVQVGTSSWMFVKTADQSTYGILSDLTLFSWGLGTSGQLGSGLSISRSSPVQVGTSFWTFISSAGNAGATVSTAAAIRSDGRLFMWGVNNFSQLGNLRFANQSSPVVVTTYRESFNIVSSGGSHVVAIRNDGSLFSWGDNTNGQIGDSTRAHRSYPTQIGMNFWNNISAGTDHTLALNNDNNLFAWGLNTSGQLGDNTLLSKSSPVQIGSGVFADIKTGPNSSYLRKNNSLIYGWGANNGQFGSLGVKGNKNSPTLIATRPDMWSNISAANPGLFALGIRKDGYLLGWGQNTSGQLGLNEILNKSNPTQLGASAPVGYYSILFNGSTSYLSVANNAAFNFGSSDFTIEFWFFATASIPAGNFPGIVSLRGSNVSNHAWSTYAEGNNNLRFVFTTDGSGSSTSNFAPVQSYMPSRWNHYSVCRIGTTLYSSLNGVVNSTTVTSSPVFNGTTALVIGKLDTLASNPIYFWPGYISNLRIVKGTALYTSDFTPSTVPLQNITNTSLLTCQNPGYIDNSSNAFTVNSVGSAAIATLYPSSFAMPAGGLDQVLWTKISAGSSFTGGLTSTRDLYTWGDNASGQLGIEVGSSPTGTWLLPKSSPVQVGTVGFAASPVQVGSSSWTSISAGMSHIVARRTDGILFAWGFNGSSQLGEGTTVHRSSPVQIGTSSWVMASAGDQHTLAVSNNRTLFGWGQTGYDSNTVPFLMPYTIDLGIFTNIATGSQHAIALKPDGSLWTWGVNTSGQLGLSDLTHRSSPVQIGTSSWIAISADGARSYAIRSDGRLFGWGDNIVGQVGDNTTVHRSSPVQLGSEVWSQLGGESIALRADGTLWAWGTNTLGRVGDNTTIHRSSPVQIGTNTWSSVSAAFTHVSAIRSDGLLFTWGDNSINGALGDNSVIRRSSPVQIGAATWRAVSSGNYFTYGIQSNFTLWTWGNNFSGQLGDPTKVHRSAPVQVGTSSWIGVVAGEGYGVMTRLDGSLFGTGVQLSGQLGLNDVGSRSSPVQIGTGSWAKVSLMSESMLRLSTGNSLFATGLNTSGQMGINDVISRSSPVQIGSFSTTFSNPTQISTDSWSVVSAGISHSLGIKLDNTLWGWGGPEAGTFNTYSWSMISTGRVSDAPSAAIRSDGLLFVWGNGSRGALGLNNQINRSRPVQLGSFSWKNISVAANSMLAIRQDNTLWSWGSNVYGELGSNNRIHRSSPAQVGTGLWKNISLDQHAVAIDDSDRLWAWGQNQFGQLGLNAVGLRSSPVQVGTSSWIQVAVGSTNSYSIRVDGAMFAFGQSASGKLGDNTVTNRSSPVQIGTSSWTAVSAGTAHVIGLTATGQIFSWGDNTSGQLGDNTVINKSSPVQVGSSSWKMISAGADSSVAISNNDTLWTWGSNQLGQLGTNDLIDRSSPVQVGAMKWLNLASGNRTFATREDGVLYGFGSNQAGALGSNDTTDRSSPTVVGTITDYVVNPTSIPTITQIGNSNWSSVSAGNNYSMVTRLTDNALFAWGFNQGALLSGSLLNMGYSSVQISSGISHFGFVKKS